MRHSISLNDLPQWSPWPARLLGINPFSVSARTIEKVDSEYDKDKYAKCLEFYLHSEHALTPDDVKWTEFSSDASAEVCISEGNALFVTTLGEGLSRYYDLIVNTMEQALENCKTIVELGAGYGYNLWMLKQRMHHQVRFLGGECSANAIQLASLLYKNRVEGNYPVSVLPFNFYDAHSYSFLDSEDSPMVIFTSHSVEQCPRSAMILDSLFRYREKIKAVFHFEPCFEAYDQTLLGLMRHCYAEVNDYNRDLLSELRMRSYIRILNLQPNVFGINPLNPTSIIKWEFVS
ncbi:MAG: hypothetical protein PHX83_14425 [Acidobacteriia bacterium]|nr:hypothetical protein [Terriglobia bacterium]